MSRPVEARLLGSHAHPLPVRGVALLLPGGDIRSRKPLPSWDVSVMRMRMFHGAIDTFGTGRILPLTLKYRYVGWNDGDPARDARWALDTIARRLPARPVVLVGHSMGGRAAIRVAAHPAVAALCLLAPWITKEESPDMLAGKPLHVMHAPADFATDPDASARFVARAQDAGIPATWEPMRYDNHPMLLRAVTWHARTARFVTREVNAASGVG